MWLMRVWQKRCFLTTKNLDLPCSHEISRSAVDHLRPDLAEQARETPRSLITTILGHEAWLGSRGIFYFRTPTIPYVIVRRNKMISKHHQTDRIREIERIMLRVYISTFSPTSHICKRALCENAFVQRQSQSFQSRSTDRRQNQISSNEGVSVNLERHVPPSSGLGLPRTNESRLEPQMTSSNNL